MIPNDMPADCIVHCLVRFNLETVKVAYCAWYFHAVILSPNEIETLRFFQVMIKIISNILRATCSLQYIGLHIFHEGAVSDNCDDITK